MITEANHYYSTFEVIENKENSFVTATDPQVIIRFNEEVHFVASHIWDFKRKVLELIVRCEILGADVVVQMITSAAVNLEETVKRGDSGSGRCRWRLRKINLSFY